MTMPMSQHCCLLRPCDQIHNADMPYGTFVTVIVRYKSTVLTQCQVRIAPLVIEGENVCAQLESFPSTANSNLIWIEIVAWEKRVRPRPLQTVAHPYPSTTHMAVF